MKTLTEITVIFGDLDNNESEKTAIHTVLHNTTKRHFFPPDEQQGRAFKYNFESTVMLRFVYIADEFGLGRMTRDNLNAWLRRQILPQRGSLTNIAEAIRRAKLGENFSIHIDMDGSGKTWCSADWQTQTKSERVMRNLEMTQPRAVARFTLPASDLIRDLASAFEA